MVQPAVEVKGKIQSPHAGVDRSYVPETRGKKPTFDSVWTDELYRRSTFDFIGVYLTDKDALPVPTKKNGIYDQLYTEPSGYKSGGWVTNYAELEAMGWAMIFFYVGYSIRAGFYNTMPPYDMASRIEADAENARLQRRVKTPKIRMSNTLAAERGALHAEHVKKILRRLPGVRQNGAVVCLDNEGGDYLQENLAVYFLAFFAALQDPGDDLLAVRPALYSYHNITFPLLQKQPDLFVWHIDEKAPVGWRKTKNRPWTEGGGRLVVQPEHFPITIYRLASSADDHMIPLGWQFLADEEVSSEGIIIPRKNDSVSPTLRRMPKWDLDVSLVRDPRYPEANPRFAVLGQLAVRGDYRKVVLRDTAGAILHRAVSPGIPAAQPTPNSVLAMAIRERGGDPQAKAIEGEPVEPDAPLVLCSSSTLFTVLKGGVIGTSRRSAPNAWTPMATLATQSAPPPLRRLRGLAAIALSPTQPNLFYVSEDCQLLWVRSVTQGKWAKPEVASSDVRVHPLSNIAVAYLESTRVDAFFIDTGGLLSRVSWRVAGPGKEWTDKEVQRLESDTPKLLLGTAISVVTVANKHTLLFAVGRDLRLYMTAFTKGAVKWSALAPLEPPGGGLAKPSLFAHSRLSAAATGENQATVACIRNDGMPVVYVAFLSSKSGVWSHDAGKHLVLNREVTKPGTEEERRARKNLPVAARAKIEAEERAALGLNGRDEDEATGWSINPYGDVGLASEGGNLTAYYAGTAAPGRTGILRRNLQPPSKEWVLITGGEPIPWPEVDAIQK